MVRILLVCTIEHAVGVCGLIRLPYAAVAKSAWPGALTVLSIDPASSDDSDGSHGFGVNGLTRTKGKPHEVQRARCGEGERI